MANPDNLISSVPNFLNAISVETSMDIPKRVGLIIFFLVFGVFGVWAAIAPIDGAAHAPGLVSVKSYKKIIQHLEGGIVSDIRVQNGDFVAVGETILKMDDTQSLAQLEIANSQFVALKARESRLIAERDGLDSVLYPQVLSSQSAAVAQEISAQNEMFQARKATLEGSIEVLEQRIEQLRSKLVGLKALKESKEMLANSYAEELDDIRVLLAKGFSDKNRLREVERNFAVQSGEAAELTSGISSTEVEIGEARLQALQLTREFKNQVVTELSDVQTNLKDVTERVRSLQDVVSRTVVKAPVAGIVNGMQYHTVGGVVGAGSPIAEIVPQAEELIIEARVSPVDIDRVSEGLEASIRFSSFSRSVPTIYGNVLSLSADALFDESTGMSYYLARIEVSPEGMADLGNLVLLPGMPTEVFINTGSRTLLQYLFKPFSDSMARSFRED